MSNRTYSMTVNDDGTATVRYGDWAKTVPLEVGDDGRAHVKVCFGPYKAPDAGAALDGADDRS